MKLTNYANADDARLYFEILTILKIFRILFFHRNKGQYCHVKQMLV